MFVWDAFEDDSLVGESQPKAGHQVVWIGPVEPEFCSQIWKRWILIKISLHFGEEPENFTQRGACGGW